MVSGEALRWSIAGNAPRHHGLTAQPPASLPGGSTPTLLEAPHWPRDSSVSRAEHLELDALNYVTLRTNADLLAAAARHATLVFRLLNLSLPIRWMDARLRGRLDWEEWKAKRQPGDRILPFVFNRNTLAMRSGYVVVRAGSPVYIILTEVS